jgi:hypothetical protein
MAAAAPAPGAARCVLIVGCFLALGRLHRMSARGHLRRLTDVHSWSAWPPIATVMADVAALPLCATKRSRWTA